MANIYVAAQSTWNGKALKKAKKDVSVFDQQIKSLGKTFAGVFGARALFNYGKNAVKAFAADEAAAKALELQLKNTGNAFATPSVELYIANLQKTTGVIDDQLRPAFQQLLTVTGSVAQSQAALDTALNVSAATGKSLTEVSAALSKGYAGNTTALTRLGAGLDKTTLKSGDMNKILEELNNKFAGQAQARLTTYAGKMDLLKVASENVKEEIGKGILGALDALSKDTSIEDTTKKMENLGVQTGKTITGIGVLIAELKKIPGADALGNILFGTNIFNMLAKLTELSQPKPTSNFTYSLGPSAIKDVERANAILKTNKERAKELALLKEKNALEALKMKYDVERIGLMAALNAATDEETRTRLAEKLAILDGNAALAKKYLADSYAADATEKLADSVNKATAAAMYFSDWLSYRAGERGDSLSSSTPAAVAAAVGGGSYTPSYSMTQSPDYQSYRAGERGDITINNNVSGSILAQDLEQTIQDAILNLTRQGRGLTPAGGLSGGT